MPAAVLNAKRALMYSLRYTDVLLINYNALILR